MSSSLEAFLRPRSIALIGASHRPNSLGGRVTARLFGSGYQGRLIPVNPRPDPIHGLTPVASIAAAEGPIDLALIAIPRDAVRGAVAECLDKGIPAICVVTAGFKEVDAEGAALERELVALVRAAGARLIGPNCMGITNTSPHCTFDATFSPVPPLAGPIGFASQSGALGVAVLNVCHQRQIGFSQFVSMGNKADVAEDDLLEAWADDPEVRVIAMYLESVRDPRRFLQAARRVTKKKPVVVVKAGRTAAGARAASSHTGALAGADEGAEALFRQAGVLRVDTIEEMLDTALALSRCALPAGNRVAVLTNAGGPGIMAADALDRSGLKVAELQPATRDSLRAILPREAAVTNPVDMIASAGPSEYGACLDLLLKDPGVDAAVPVVVTPPAWDARDVLTALNEAAGHHQKPVLGVFMVGEDLKRLAATPDTIPTFPQPEGAARALADMVRSALWRAAGAGAPLDFPADETAIASRLAARAATGGGYLDADATFRVLDAAGIPRAAGWALPPGASAAALADAAEAVGFPVVLKATGEALVHKSDAGGVALDLGDRAAVERAATTMTEALVRAGQAPASWEWFVQAFRRGGREVIVGATRDPHYGPLVMFGLGGRFVEVFHDVVFGLAPLNRADAERMVRGIRGLALLTGTRGEAGVDLAPAIETLGRVACLMERHPEIVELDLNPLLLYPEAARAAAVDARIRVAPAPAPAPEAVR
ncbi:MAG: acetate--CoA ligase family protein [Acidobacteria bacterium]|nr:acetate--CoA ligase family protein [Acidobacteriota bacterium]